MSSFEFDGLYSAHTGNRVTDWHYVPDVMHDDAQDVLINERTREDARALTGWDVLTGHTGQYGYRGAVMHPSETADDDTLRAWVREAGGDIFAIVEVRDENGEYPDGDPIGWAVLYRAEEVTANRCQAPGDNHSLDLIAVYSGHPQPAILCGYHEMNRPTGKAHA